MSNFSPEFLYSISLISDYVIEAKASKATVFVQGNSFQPSTVFVRKAGAYIDIGNHQFFCIQHFYFVS